MARFPYYARLGKRRQAIYRRSDAVVDVPLPDDAPSPSWADTTCPLLEALRAGLEADDRRATGAATRQLATVVCEALEVPPVILRVLARRPHDATSELHGLYEREEDKTPIIRVWMRTAAHEQPVAFRTFLRVVMHELCHHLDYELYALDDSMHTHGFFRRESSLVRQLLIHMPDPEFEEPEPSPQLELPGFC